MKVPQSLQMIKQEKAKAAGGMPIMILYFICLCNVQVSSRTPLKWTPHLAKYFVVYSEMAFCSRGYCWLCPLTIRASYASCRCVGARLWILDDVLIWVLWIFSSHIIAGVCSWEVFIKWSSTVKSVHACNAMLAIIALLGWRKASRGQAFTHNIDSTGEGLNCPPLLPMLTVHHVLCTV